MLCGNHLKVSRDWFCRLSLRHEDVLGIGHLVIGRSRVFCCCYSVNLYHLFTILFYKTKPSGGKNVRKISKERSYLLRIIEFIKSILKSPVILAMGLALLFMNCTSFCSKSHLFLSH